MPGPDKRGGGSCGRDLSPEGRIPSRVVGHLVVGNVDRGQLVAELKSLAAKKWTHPITGSRVTFSYSTIEQLVLRRTQQFEGPSPRAIQGATGRRVPYPDRQWSHRQS